MTARPLIFLDVDGVLNSIAWFEQRGSFVGDRTDPSAWLVFNVDPAALAQLNRLCAATGAQIVVSSTWRKGSSVRGLHAEFAALGCVARIIGKTPELHGAPRGQEIAAWLAAHPGQGAAFVILDDAADMEPHLEHLVQTRPATGLTADDVERASAILAQVG